MKRSLIIFVVGLVVGVAVGYVAAGRPALTPPSGSDGPGGAALPEPEASLLASGAVTVWGLEFSGTLKEVGEGTLTVSGDGGSSVTMTLDSETDFFVDDPETGPTMLTPGDFSVGDRVEGTAVMEGGSVARVILIERVGE